ncbi:MAG: Trigger factor [Fimbriimonadaceae bacterium]|nr:Trigger factor [Fimbriimonadaceae bacterium]
MLSHLVAFCIGHALSEPIQNARAAPGDVVTAKVSWIPGKDRSKMRGELKVWVVGKSGAIPDWDAFVLDQVRGSTATYDVTTTLNGEQRQVGQVEIAVLRVDKQGVKPVIEIETIKQGQGDAASEGDTVQVHYTGTFLDGKKFDSSKDRGQAFPVEIGVTRLITGFTQGLIGIKKGEVRKVTIPYELAYGADGRPPVIPPMSTLVFELECLELKKKG